MLKTFTHNRKSIAWVSVTLLLMLSSGCAINNASSLSQKPQQSTIPQNQTKPKSIYVFSQSDLKMMYAMYYMGQLGPVYPAKTTVSYSGGDLVFTMKRTTLNLTQAQLQGLQNAYIQSASAQQKGTDVQVILHLSKQAKYYTGAVSHQSTPTMILASPGQIRRHELRPTRQVQNPGRASN